jgi:integrase
LPEGRKPYWRLVERGLHVGYRRGPRGGVWFARRFVGQSTYAEIGLGAADDMSDADGVSIFNFAQAQEAARKWWQAEIRRTMGLEPKSEGPYTVADAIRDYLAARERKGSKGVTKDRSYANTRILPELGNIEVAKLTPAKLRRWHGELSTLPKMVRTKAKATRRATKEHSSDDGDAVRARRATANRVLTILKAALNHAYHEHHVASNEAWRRTKPFREVDAAVVRYLSGAECLRLVNACDPAFRDLVCAALLTGCRYGELAKMQTGDFNRDSGTVFIRKSKAGRARHVVLTEEGQRLLAGLTAGKTPQSLIFNRDDGAAWGPSHQKRPLEKASLRARIEPEATFHVLRHTYASTLAMRGVPMGVIAAQLGHSDTRMTEKHYAHLAPSYVADTIRAHFPTLGVGEHRSNVVSL